MKGRELDDAVETCARAFEYIAVPLEGTVVSCLLIHHRLAGTQPRHDPRQPHVVTVDDGIGISLFFLLAPLLILERNDHLLGCAGIGRFGRHRRRRRRDASVKSSTGPLQARYRLSALSRTAGQLALPRSIAPARSASHSSFARSLKFRYRRPSTIRHTLGSPGAM